MKKSKYLSFLYAFLMGFSLNIIGKLFWAELLALLSLPTIKINRLLKYIPKLRSVLVCLLFLLIAQVISDLINSTASEDYLRGWALIVFAAVSSIFLINQFVGEEKNIIYFLIGALLVKVLFGEEGINLQELDVNTNYFKSRLMGFVNAAVLILSYLLMKKDKYKHVVFLFLSYALLCFILDARSNGLSFLLTAILLSIKFFTIRLSIKNVLSFGITSLSLLYILYVVYVNQVLYNDFGGTNAYVQLSKASNPYNPLELIYYGRTDFFVLIEAIKDSPFIGHGSWAKDPGLKYAKLLQLLNDTDTIKDSGTISAHSILLGYWAYAGLAGVVCIIVLYSIILRLIFSIFSSKIIFNTFPIVIFVSIESIWHLFFSPIAHLRESFPFFIAIVLSTSYKINLFKKKRKFEKFTAV